MGPNSCATVTIKGEPSAENPTGNIVVNECDFDETTMTKVEDGSAEVEKQAEPVAPVVPVAPIPPTDPKKSSKVVAPWAA